MRGTGYRAVTPHRIDEWVAVYRLYDDDEVLLYVGISNLPGYRFHQHEASKFWWNRVAHHELEWYPNRIAALCAEETAIWQEDPIYNIDRPLPESSRRGQRRNELAPLSDSLDGYLAFCERGAR